jgi:DNA-binding MarR family transcriptional regulator
MITRTPQGRAATDVVLATLRAAGLLLAAGDALTARHGLSAARWQVLGAINLAGRPLTVPQIARRMGLTRQSVHTSVKRLLRDGLVELAPNADHIRSRLVCLTDSGQAAYSAVDEVQAAWINGLADGMDRNHLDATVGILNELCRRLDDDRTSAVA